MSFGLAGASVGGRSPIDSGGSVLMMDRTRRRRRPVWSVWMLGWQSSFFHVVVGETSERLMVGQADLGDWGADGV